MGKRALNVKAIINVITKSCVISNELKTNYNVGLIAHKDSECFIKVNLYSTLSLKILKCLPYIPR